MLYEEGGIMIFKKLPMGYINTALHQKMPSEERFHAALI